MKRITYITTGIIILFGLVLIFQNSLLFADVTFENKSEIYEITFSSKDISFTQLKGYDRVSLSDGIPMRVVGSPELHYRVLNFIIPDGMAISKVEIIKDETEVIKGKYNIYPAQKSVKYGDEPTFELPNPDVYSSSNTFPGNIIEKSTQGALSGVNIASIRIYPIQYLPAQKTILLHTRIKFCLYYEATTLPIPNINHSKRSTTSLNTIKHFLKKNVYNSEKIDEALGISMQNEEKQKGNQTNQLPESIDYVIITSESLIDSGVFNPLLQSRHSDGLITYIESVSSIEANYSGRDTPEKIRNFIKDLYENHGLIYVLLAGDTNIVPVRYAVHIEEGNPIIDYIPCEMYYSDLDGTWDANTNNLFGEPEDDIDFYPDVFVGRAPVENETEADVFVDKILIFDSVTFADYGNNKALFMGAEDFDNAGGENKELIDSLYVPHNYDPITKLYEINGNENRQNAIAALNEGYCLVNHIDHGDIDKLVTGDDYLSIEDIDALSNYGKFSVLWSVGCLPAAIDYDCIAEYWLTNPNGGGVAFVGNSRSGLHPESDSMLDPEFYKSLFLDRIYNVGETLADSKITFISEANTNEAMRYVLYTLHLLGDPATKIPLPPIAITFPEENQTLNTLTPTIRWDTYGIEPEENLRLVISHTGISSESRPSPHSSLKSNFMRFLSKVIEFFDVQPAYAVIGLRIITDLDVIVPNTGSYRVPQGILSEDISYTLKLSQETEPDINDIVHFRVSLIDDDEK